MTRPLSTRVKALVYTLGAAVLAAVLSSVTALDYAALLGPQWSPVAALAIGSLVSYLVTDTAVGRFLREHGQPDAADLIDDGASR